MGFRQVCYRYALAVDESKNLIFAGNGNLLEVYTHVQDGYNKRLQLLNIVAVVSAPLVISQVYAESGYVIVGAGTILSLLDERDGKLKVRFKCNINDNMAAVKFLKNDMTVVVVTRKKQLYCYKLENLGLRLIKQILLEPVSTIFSACFVGESLAALRVITGGIFGEIEGFKLCCGFQKKLFSLKGLNGMVLAICATPTHIFTVGDDRSFRVFTVNEGGKQQYVGYGHENRIRAICCDDSDPSHPYIYTAGDLISVWSYDTETNVGHLVHRFESATGKVMAITCADDYLIGCSVQGTLFNAEVMRQQMFLRDTPNLGIVRAFVKTDDATYFVIDNNKNLKFRKLNEDLLSVKNFQNLDLRFDALLLTPDNKTVVTTSYTAVYIIDAATHGNVGQFQMPDVLGGVCLIENDYLLAVASNGKAIIVQISDYSVTNFQIKKCLPIKCAITNGPSVVIGTGKGHVLLYNKKTNDIVSSVYISQKKDIVVDLHWNPNQAEKTLFFALTKDGTCSLITIKNTVDLEIIETWSTVKTPAGFLSSKNPSNSAMLYIWGFRGDQFVVAALREPDSLISYRCGGGNRIMSVFPAFEGDALRNVCFEYIKDGEVIVVEGKIPKITFDMGPFHKSEIYGAIEISRHGEASAVITVGVDTQVILCNISEDGLLKPVCRNHSHLSSIHCVEAVNWNNQIFIITAGGRSEVRLWQVVSNYLNPLATYKGKPDYRVVSVKVFINSDKLFVVAATSIRELHIYSFNMRSLADKPHLIYAFKSPDMGTFAKVAVSPNFLSIFVVGTSGMVYALSWPQTSVYDNSSEPKYRSQKPNEAAASGLCSVPASVPRAKDVAIMGDDSGTLYVVDFTASEPLLAINDLHSSQISDMIAYLGDNDSSSFRLASVSSDSVLAIIAISNDFSTFEKLISKQLSVGDPMSLRLTSFGFIIAGEGLQAICFDELEI